jgi:hypothetical protein
MFEESLHYKASMLTQPRHGDDLKLYDVPNLTERTTPLYLLWGPHSDFSKCGSYFCRTLYMQYILDLCQHRLHTSDQCPKFTLQQQSRHLNGHTLDCRQVMFSVSDLAMSNIARQVSLLCSLSMDHIENITPKILLSYDVSVNFATMPSFDDAKASAWNG